MRFEWTHAATFLFYIYALSLSLSLSQPNGYDLAQVAGRGLTTHRCRTHYMHPLRIAPLDDECCARLSTTLALLLPLPVLRSLFLRGNDEAPGHRLAALCADL